MKNTIEQIICTLLLRITNYLLRMIKLNLFYLFLNFYQHLNFLLKNPEIIKKILFIWLANVSQGNQHQGHGFLDSSLKRRSMNSTNFGTSGSNNNSSPVSSAYGNASSLFGSSNLGPNASHILQNSSLASSARLNSATSNSAAASVLGS